MGFSMYLEAYYTCLTSEMKSQNYEHKTFFSAKLGIFFGIGKITESLGRIKYSIGKKKLFLLVHIFFVIFLVENCRCGELCLWRILLWRSVVVEKCRCGQVSLWRNVAVVNCRVENSLWRTDCGEMTCGELSVDHT